MDEEEALARLIALAGTSAAGASGAPDAALLRAVVEEASELGARRALSMPGLSATVGEQIEALRKVAGDKAVALIRPEPDPAIMAIVEGWPRDFTTARAEALGFRAESSFEEIIRIHIEDELGGQI